MNFDIYLFSKVAKANQTTVRNILKKILTQERWPQMSVNSKRGQNGISIYVDFNQTRPSHTLQKCIWNTYNGIESFHA